MMQPQMLCNFLSFSRPPKQPRSLCYHLHAGRKRCPTQQTHLPLFPRTEDSLDFPCYKAACFLGTGSVYLLMPPRCCRQYIPTLDLYIHDSWSNFILPCLNPTTTRTTRDHKPRCLRERARVLLADRAVLHRPQEHRRQLRPKQRRRSQQRQPPLHLRPLQHLQHLQPLLSRPLRLICTLLRARSSPRSTLFATRSTPTHFHTQHWLPLPPT